MENILSIYSFEITKKYSSVTNRLPLSEVLPKDEDKEEFADINFIEALLKFAKDEEYRNNTKEKKLFQARLVSHELRIINNVEYECIILENKYGTYGYESELVDQKTSNQTYEQGKDEAALRAFNVLIYFPADDGSEIKPVKGFVLFESYGQYGIVTETQKQLNDYFRKNLGLFVTFRLSIVSDEAFWQSFLSHNKILEMQFLKYEKPIDSSEGIRPNDKYIYDEKQVILKGLNPQSKKFREILTRLINFSKEGNNYVEYENTKYDNAKMKVKVGNRVKTLNLSRVDTWSIFLEIPEGIIAEDDINYDKLLEFTDDVVCGYMDKINLYGDFND